jgi:hypothetical protein
METMLFSCSFPIKMGNGKPDEAVLKQRLVNGGSDLHTTLMCIKKLDEIKNFGETSLRA